MKRFAAKPRQQQRTRADLDSGWPTAPVVCEAPRPTQQYEKVCATGGPVTVLPVVGAAVISHLSPQQLEAVLLEAAPDCYED